MSEDTPALGSGIVELTLGQKTYELKADLGPALLLSRTSGGLVRMQERCIALDIDAVATVIQHGLGLTPNGVKHENLVEKIYLAGIENVAVVAITFLRVLANGGNTEETIGGTNDSANPRTEAESQ